MIADDDQPAASPTPVHLRPRRETFEFGLLPISKLIFSDGAATLAPLKERLLAASPSPPFVGPELLSEALGIGVDHARLVVDTLSAVLPSGGGGGDGGAHVDDLILFLYVQSYKRLVPKPHKDSAAVADVWPTTSAFDGYLSALSPLQLARSNSRRFMPSQVDEEAHQLSYLQKHLGNMLALLADPTEGDGDESLILTLESFEHLGLLIQCGEKGSEDVLLSQAAPFFANSDPDMPAVPVPAAHVHDWLLQNIIASLEHTADKFPAKDNGPPSTIGADVTMVDPSSVQAKNLNKARALFVEGISKSSLFKQASDINGNSVKVINCHDSVIYILAPLKYATIYGCSDATIVLGAVGKSARVEHCERVQIIAATKRMCIANCRECVFYLGVNQRPLILGDNHKLQVAPYNTHYSQLGEHMAQVGVDAGLSRWDQPLTLGIVDPHDSLSHPAGVSDVQAESPACVDPDQFTNFIIPDWFGSESPGSTKENPFILPEAYRASQSRNVSSLFLETRRSFITLNYFRHLPPPLWFSCSYFQGQPRCIVSDVWNSDKKYLMNISNELLLRFVGEGLFSVTRNQVLTDLKQAIRDAQLEDSRKRELATALHVCFKDWLYASGNIRQLYCLQGD